VRSGESLGDRQLALDHPDPIRVHPQQCLGQRVPALLGQALRGGQGAGCRGTGAAQVVHPVEYQAGQWHPVLGQPLHEIRRLAQRVPLGGGHHQERGALVLQQPIGGVGALAEPAEHGVQGRDEGLDVAQDLRAEHLGQGVGRGVHPGRQGPQVGPAADLGRRREQPDEPPVQERAEPGRGVQEVQGRPGRRGVDDHQVPGAVPVGGGPQLAELLHRHVLLGAGERAGQRLVEGIGQDLLGLVGGRVRLDDLVEGALHVEHHGVEAAAVGGVQAGYRAGGVVQLGQAQGLGQPPGRVDGQHDHAAARFRCPQPQRGGGGGLADPAGAAAQHDPGRPVDQQCLDVQQRPDVQLGHAMPCSRSSSASG
jgi:hypothetical protein